MMVENDITDISELWENGLLSNLTAVAKYSDKEYGDPRDVDYYEACWSDDDELNEIVESLTGDI
jgi:hypothetical protein